jgi:hypothetical protein
MRCFRSFTAAALLGGACLLLTAAPPASADNIVLGGDRLVGSGFVNVYGQTAYTVNGAVGNQGQERNPRLVNHTTLAVSGTGFSSTAAYDFTQSHLKINFDQTINRSNNEINLARTYNYLTFTVATNTAYQLSGQIQRGASSNGNIDISGDLYDFTNNTYDVQAGNSSGDPTTTHLTLGSNDGLLHSVSGQLSGTLWAGHTYAFTGFAVSDSGTAASSGFLELSFEALVNDPAATPLPSAVCAGAALLGGAGLMRRREFPA